MAKFIITFLFGITGLAFIAYAAYAAAFTLAGSVEREMIASGEISYLGYFLLHLLAFKSPGISYAFYSGVFIISLSVMIFIRGKSDT